MIRSVLVVILMLAVACASDSPSPSLTPSPTPKPSPSPSPTPSPTPTPTPPPSGETCANDFASCGSGSACYAGTCRPLGCAGGSPSGCDALGLPTAPTHTRCGLGNALCSGAELEADDRIPLWLERSTMLLLNAVRVAPQSFHQAYIAPRVSDSSGANVFSSGTLPAKAPVYWDANAAIGARYHATNRTTCTGSTGGSPHNLCDGTSFGTWAGSFVSGGFGHNFWDYSVGWRGLLRDLPLAFVNGWVCDGPMSQTGGLSSCPTDANAGHRKNIMQMDGDTGAGYAQVGTRYTAGTLHKSEATSRSYVPVLGSHFFHNGQIKFGLAVRDASAPARIDVVVAGEPLPLTLTLELGSNNRGVYTRAGAIGSGCRSYHFAVVDAAGKLWRYPASGELRTFGEGGCGEDFAP